MWLVRGQRKIFKNFSRFNKIPCSSKLNSNILIDNIEVNNQKDINDELKLYYKNLFTEKQHLQEHDINNYLNAISKFPQ